MDDESLVYTNLMAITFETRLENETNDLVLVEKTSIARDELTLANYFFQTS